MAIWENKFKTDIKIDPVFAALKSLLSDGSITKMTSFVDYSPTKLMTVLKMNHQTFIDKCKEPWKFSTEHILILSYIIDIDPVIIFEIIQKESLEHLNERANQYINKIKIKSNP